MKTSTFNINLCQLQVWLFHKLGLLDELTLLGARGAGLMIMKRVMRVAVQTDSNARENCCCTNNNFRNFINFRNQNDSKRIVKEKHFLCCILIFNP